MITAGDSSNSHKIQNMSPPTGGKIGFVSLGCPKALVDSERIITQLRAEGYALTQTYHDADLVIVNTCGFIDSAVEESLATIGEALAENGKVIVTGCLGAKREVILNKYPHVLSVTGPQAYDSVLQAVHENLPPQHHPFFDLLPPQGIKLTPKHYAYLKISEGCNHKCTFCIIPSMRGRLVSRKIDDVLREAEYLAQAGVKELLVISQDTSAYGVDCNYAPHTFKDKIWQTRFYDLCKALGEMGIWVRLHYVYPYPHVDEIIPLMSETGLLPYLDIPFQHASANILKLMKRPAHSEKVLERIQAWRQVQPNLSIRSTFIVGFPGETEADFAELLEFLRIAQLDRVGCFQYSPVEGAQANQLPNPVAEEIKQERFERFMQTQAEISAQRLANQVGRNMTVLIDQVDTKIATARGPGDAPEIDGQVFIKNPKNIKVGDFVAVKITKSDTYDLWAKPVK